MGYIPALKTKPPADRRRAQWKVLTHRARRGKNAGGVLESFDDAEVYNNIKNSRPQLEPWQKKALQEWKVQHPGEEPEKNWNLSMDGLMMTENPDTSIYVKQLAEMAAEEPDPLKELLYEILSRLPEEDQELYRLYYTEGYSQEEIAEMKEVSQNTISKKLRRIKKQLTEMCRKAV